MVVLRPRRRVLYAAAPEAMFGARLGVHETGPPEAAKPRLLDRVRQAIRARLAVNGKVAASTQNQALSAILFLYGEVPGVELPWLDGLVRAKSPQRLPVVMTREEVRAVLALLRGVSRLMALLLHGAGLRLLEYCRRRVKDVDFAMNQIVIRDGKGHKDRVTMLPDAVKAELAAYIERAREQHQADLRRGAGWVELPWALARKYPNAGREWGCSGCSRRRGSTWNGSPASGAATTCTSPCSSGP